MLEKEKRKAPAHQFRDAPDYFDKPNFFTSDLCRSADPNTSFAANISTNTTFNVTTVVNATFSITFPI